MRLFPPPFPQPSHRVGGRGFEPAVVIVAREGCVAETRAAAHKELVTNMSHCRARWLAYIVQTVVGTCTRSASVGNAAVIVDEKSNGPRCPPAYLELDSRAAPPLEWRLMLQVDKDEAVCRHSAT